jgi:pimeloyl-ACP methyl ester carboxylesterase
MQQRSFPRLARLVLGLVVLALVGPAGASAAPGSPEVAALVLAGASEVQDVYVRPPQAAAAQPLQVAIVLHGMGGNGRDFAAPLTDEADRNGWVLVAPTINYGDWTDPAQIAREDPALISWLSDYIGHLSERTGIPSVQPRVLLFGHSRGAQLSLRFTELHPEQVTAVAAVSAGTYTLPMTTAEFPFGFSNIASNDGGVPFSAESFAGVPVWVGVGGQDTNPADVPHAWDVYIGKTRVERARSFTRALQQLGCEVSLTVFPGADHGLTERMYTEALDDLALEQAARTSGPDA